MGRGGGWLRRRGCGRTEQRDRCDRGKKTGRQGLILQSTNRLGAPDELTGLHLYLHSRPTVRRFHLRCCLRVSIFVAVSE
ncbi:unnamed protein product [Protopolystoma xenopodis]|uniref:Uncharacterized protein n=1 Tax=Protopolystoma xenopodis TaxID=117903 RepID=A0A448WIY5_9PLAT|nr:unnamed protein product [Protopolystoma xenopodis]